MGNMNDISFTNYNRPITVSITITKLLTSILNERILKWVLDNKILHQEQIEFQKNSRPSDHLFVLKTLIDCYKNAGKKLYTCFIDFQKAFDNTWRMGLFYKLISYNLNLNTINTMTIPEIRKISINIFPDIPSPLLFNLFKNDIPDIFDDKCDPVFLMNRKINKLDTYTKIWDLNINSSKKISLLFKAQDQRIRHLLKLG